MTDPAPADEAARAKREVRRALRARRDAFHAALSEEERVRLSQVACARLADDIAAATCVAAFIPFASEMDPRPALAMAAARGIRTALPHVVSRARPMRFLSWTPGTELITGMYGLSQPDEAAEELQPDLIVMPLVGFDRALQRIGNGAGFYDRTIASLPGAKRVAFAWSVQEVAEIPTDPWDQPLDAVVTELERIEREPFES